MRINNVYCGYIGNIPESKFVEYIYLGIFHFFKLPCSSLTNHESLVSLCQDEMISGSPVINRYISYSW